jgi:predicted peptidase
MKKRKKLLLIIIPACVLALCAAGLGIYLAVTGTISEADKRVVDMMPAEVYKGPEGKLPYRIYVPGDSDPAREYPLVLYLHHVARRGRDNRAQMRDNYAQFLLSEENLAKYPCIFLAPQCPKNQAWVPGHDEGFADNAAAVMGLLEQVCAEYPVDRSRIYITGMSMGGFGTWGMLAAYPGYFAAAAPICGGWLQKSDVEYAPLLTDVPIWAFHGALDTAVPVERTRDMVEALEAIGGNIKYTEYPEEGHLIGEKVYSEPALFPWLFAQTKN